MKDKCLTSCTYSKAMVQEFPRKCINCGHPEHEAKKEPLTDSQISYGEEAVQELAKSLNIAPSEVIEILENGLDLNPDIISDEVKNYFLDELKATFDAY